MRSRRNRSWWLWDSEKRVRSNDPIRRVWGYYRTAATWGALLLSATFLENLPLWNGKVFLLPFIPLVAGWRRGRVTGLFVGITAGFLQDWTADGLFGAAGVLFGGLGYLCGVVCG